MRISDWSSDVCSSDLDISQRKASDDRQHNHGRNPAPCQTPAISRDCQRRHYKQHSDEQHQGGNDTRHKRPSVRRSEEHTSELQSLMRISYAVFCLKKKKDNTKSSV